MNDANTNPKAGDKDDGKKEKGDNDDKYLNIIKDLYNVPQDEETRNKQKNEYNSPGQFDIGSNK